MSGGLGGVTCSTCAHWEPPADRKGYGNVVSFAEDEYDDNLDGGWGGYLYGDAADRLFGECGAINLGSYLPPGPAPLAVTQDASNYVANLYTQAEFGCAMHRPANEEAR